jgi:Zn-dependent protease
VHEFSHAATARSLGDPTAQRAGRLTLNPLRHLDPFGSLLLVLTLVSGAPGFGWGRPVPVDPRNLRYGRLGMALVSAAGPLANVGLALLIALVFRLTLSSDQGLPVYAQQFGVALIRLNVSLCVFNLLPIAPLDGFGVVVGLLPLGLARPVARLGQYGPGILLLLIFSASLIRVNLLGLILGPPSRALLALVFHVAGG